MEAKIYLDNAATTYVNNEVLAEMLPAFTNNYGNNSSLHSFGKDAEALVEQARERVAKSIGAKASEIYFTSGATEANNLAILGIAEAYRKKGMHIITSQIEHPSVLEACKKLEKAGYCITYLPVNEEGLVNIAMLLNSIRKETTLISIMMANNEVGTIQNIRTISKIAHTHNILVHTDAVQALGGFAIDVASMGIDALSLSAHKIYGPKGVGALYLKKGIAVTKQMLGGEQEKNLRAGTVNVPGVVGFGKACEITIRDMVLNNQKAKYLREYLFKQIKENIHNVYLNGHLQQRLANCLNVSFEGVEGEAILLMLDSEGIAVSTGSACKSKHLEPSHVLTAMRTPVELAQCSIRFSIGRNTTKQDIDYTVQKLIKIIEQLREISPIAPKKKRSPKNV